MFSSKRGVRAGGAEPAGAASNDRLYRRLAAGLFNDLANGKYRVGDRLPAERELAVEHGVSRQAVREAMIALEVQGLVEVRVGSGAHVIRLPADQDQPGFNVTAFELIEARLLIEGESAALAAMHITDDELDRLDGLVTEMGDQTRLPVANEDADRAFHMLIAAGTRNAAMVHVIDEMWRLRSTSPEVALLLEKARSLNIRPVVEEHRAIVAGLRTRDPATARAAMRAHLSATIEHLLFATEEQAIAEARRAMESTRARFSRATRL